MPPSLPVCEPDVHTQIADLRRATLQLANAVERLTRLEERHANTANGLERAFGALSKITERVTALEHAAPLQAMASRWVFGAATGVLGALGALVAQRLMGGA